MLGLKLFYEKYFRRQFVRYHITPICNYNCVMCSSSYFTLNKTKPTEMSFKAVKDAVNKFNSFFMRRPVFFITGGEPLLAENIIAITDYMISQGNKVILISTLGVKEEIVEKLNPKIDIIVSLHGTREINDSIVKCQGAFDTAISNMSILKRKGHFLGVNSVLLPMNHSILCDMVSKVAPFINDLDIQHLMWKKEDLEHKKYMIFDEAEIENAKNSLSLLKKKCNKLSINYREFGLTAPDFKTHYLSYSISKGKHKCLNRRFSLSNEGKVRPCFGKEFGDIKKDSLGSILKNKILFEESIKEQFLNNRIPTRCMKCYNHEQTL